MRTTLDFNDATLAELRTRAAEEQKPFKKLVNETLQLGLAAKSRKLIPFRVKPLNCGIKSAYQGLSMNSRRLPRGHDLLDLDLSNHLHLRLCLSAHEDLWFMGQ